MNKTTAKFTALKNIMALCAVFGACLCFAPSAGILRTIPIVFFASALAGALDVKKLFFASFSFVMILCLYLVAGKSVLEAIFFSLIGVLFAFFGLFFVRLLKLAFKTDKEKVKNRAVILAVLCAALTVVLSLALTGNAFGYWKHDNNNRKYVRESYGELASVSYTYYDVLSGEYRTYTSFTDTILIDDKPTRVVYGEDDSLYISNKNGKLNDDIRNYFEEKIKLSAEKSLEKIVLGAWGGFKVVKSDIDFPNHELVDMSKPYTAYLDRISYVVNCDSIVSAGQKQLFATLCAEALTALAEEKFVFDNVIFCAGDANDVMYSMTADMATLAEDVQRLVLEYDESHTEKYGVTEKDILSYWQNN